MLADAVNGERSKENRAPLRTDAVLAALARGHAEDMVARGYRSHDTPEGKTYRDRLTEAGLNPIAAGENWAFVPRSPDQAVPAALALWLDSPPHRANILGDRYTRLGAGVAPGPLGGYIFVLTFAGEERD